MAEPPVGFRLGDLHDVVVVTFAGLEKFIWVCELHAQSGSRPSMPRLHHVGLNSVDPERAIGAESPRVSLSVVDAAGQKPSVDREQVPGDKTRRLRREEDGRTHHVVDLPEAPHRSAEE